jgi:hypothetical protein
LERTVQLDCQERLHVYWNSSPAARQWKFAIDNLCLVLFSTKKNEFSREEPAEILLRRKVR